MPLPKEQSGVLFPDIGLLKVENVDLEKLLAWEMKFTERVAKEKRRRYDNLQTRIAISKERLKFAERITLTPLEKCGSTIQNLFSKLPELEVTPATEITCQLDDDSGYRPRFTLQWARNQPGTTINKIVIEPSFTDLLNKPHLSFKIEVYSDGETLIYWNYGHFFAKNTPIDNINLGRQVAFAISDKSEAAKFKLVEELTSVVESAAISSR